MFFKWAIEIAIVFNHYILTNSPDFSSTIPRTRPQKGMGFMQPHLKVGTFGAFPGRGLNVPILATYKLVSIQLTLKGFKRALLV